MALKQIEGGEIIKYEGKLCEVIGYSPVGNKVVCLQVLRDEDKDKCPNCQHPIKTTFDVIEGCLNWENGAKSVKTI